MGDEAARAANLQPSEKLLLDNLTVGRVVFVQWNDQGWFQSVVKRTPWKNKTTGEWQIRVSFTMDNTEWTADVLKDVCFENPDKGAVEKIVSQRMDGSEMQYEVKWKITPMGQEWANAWHTEAELKQMDYEGWREQLDAWIADPVEKKTGSSKKSSHRKKKSIESGTEEHALPRHVHHMKSPEAKTKSPSTKRSTPASSKKSSSSNDSHNTSSGSSPAPSSNNRISIGSSSSTVSRSNAASALGSILSSSSSNTLSGMSSLSGGSGVSGINGLGGIGSLSGSSLSGISLSGIGSLGGSSLSASLGGSLSGSDNGTNHSKNDSENDGGSKSAKKSHKKRSAFTSDEKEAPRTPPPSKKKHAKAEKSAGKSATGSKSGTESVTQSKARADADENGAVVLSETVDNGESQEMRTPGDERSSKKEEKRRRKSSTEKKEKKAKREKRGRPSLLEGALNLGSQLEGEETKGEGEADLKPKKKRKPRAPKDPNTPKRPRASKKEKTWSKLTRQQIIDLAAQFVAEGPEKQELEDEHLGETKHKSSKKNKDLLGPGKKPRPVIELPSLTALSPTYQIPQQSPLTPMTASSIAAQEAAAAAVAIAVAAARAGLTTAPRKFVIAHNDSSEDDSSEETDYSLSNTSGGEDDVSHSSKKHKPKKRKDSAVEELLEPQSAEKRKPDSPLHFARSPSRSSSSPPLIIQSMPALGETQFGTSPMSREPRYDEVEQLPVPILSSESIVEPQSDQPDDGGPFSLAAALSDGAVEFLTPPQPAARPSSSVDSF